MICINRSYTDDNYRGRRLIAQQSLLTKAKSVTEKINLLIYFVGIQFYLHIKNLPIIAHLNNV